MLQLVLGSLMIPQKHLDTEKLELKFVNFVPRSNQNLTYVVLIVIQENGTSLKNYSKILLLN